MYILTLFIIFINVHQLCIYTALIRPIAGLLTVKCVVTENILNLHLSFWSYR